jgi:hypothetical protein
VDKEMPSEHVSLLTKCNGKQLLISLSHPQQIIVSNSIAASFYTILVSEKSSPLLTINCYKCSVIFISFIIKELL